MCILEDLLDYNLRAVLCGTAVGKKSREMKFYYAHSNNLFWEVLEKTGIVPKYIHPHEYKQLLSYRIGLTDLVKDEFGNDNDVRRANDNDRRLLKYKLEKYRPKFLGFTSLTAGKQFLGSKATLGEQSPIGATRVFVLPSTSLQARWQWSETSRYWSDFATALSSAGH